MENLRRAPHHRPLVAGIAVLALLFSGCSIFATRPVQEMSDTSAALKAAREVQADTLAPELYRQAQEWFYKAKHEYQLKQFHRAAEYAEKARKYAEQAEFHAIRNGANRADLSPPEAPPAAPADAYQYPTPTGTPADVYDQRKAEDEAARRAREQAQTPAASGILPTPGVPAPSGAAPNPQPNPY
jgi:hypothetical protein